MTLKKNFKKNIADAHKRKQLLYTSSRRAFIFMVFLFFLSYFAVAASFYEEIFALIFLPVYIATIISFMIFATSSILKFGENRLPDKVLYVIGFIVCVICASFLIPVL